MPTAATTAAPVLRRSSTPHPARAGRRAAVRWAKRVGLGLTALGILGAVIYAWLPKPVPVDLAITQRATLEVEIVEDGQTRVRDRFVVAATMTGTLQRIDLEPGIAVGAGDTLATIQPPLPQLLDARSRQEAAARLEIARARQRSAATSIARAKISHAQALKDATRARGLAEAGAIPFDERERAELAEQLALRELAAANAARTAAAGEVAAARAVLDDRRGADPAISVRVVAPAPGQILRVLRDSEGPVTAGTPLVELGDPRALEIVIDVLSSDAAQVAPGMPVRIERWGGDQALTARVRRVEPSAFTRISALGVEEQRVRVIATIDDPPPTVGDGFRVEARIITWRGDGVLTVPGSAVFRARGRWAVFVAEDGRARLQPITIGHRGRLAVEVTEGLSPGTRVLVHPGDQIHDGTRITAR